MSTHATDNPLRDYTVHDLFAILVRWRVVMAITFIAVFVPALLVTLLMPPLYEATATVLFSRKNTSPEYSVKSGSAELTSVYRTLERKEEMNSKIEVLKSRGIVEEVVDELHVDEAALDRIRDVRRYVRFVYKWVRNTLLTVYQETKYFLHLSPRPTPEEVAFLKREELMQEAVSRVDVSGEPDSTVIKASFRSSDPLLAQQFINLACKKFLARDAELRDSIAHNYFLDESTKRAQELHEAERKLAAARQASLAYDIDDQRRLALKSLDDTSNRLRTIAAARARSAARVASLRQQVRAEPSQVTAQAEMTRNPALDDVRREVVKLELQQSNAERRYLPETVTMQDLDARIRETRELEKTIKPQLEGSVTMTLNPVRENLRQQLLSEQTELAALEAEHASLKEQVSDYQAQLSRLGEAELSLNDAQRGVRTAEEAYTLAARNVQQAQLAEGMAGASLSGVNVVDYAPLPLSPIRPRRLLYLGIALAGSLIAALIAPFFAEFNTRAFTSEEDVRSAIRSMVVAAFPARESSKRNG